VAAQTGLADEVAPWILGPRRTRDGNLVLLCFPYAGGGASAYRGWSTLLADRAIDVWPVQLPGRENRFHEPLCTDLAQLTATLYSVLAPHLAGRRYAVYGHSAGAWMAYAFALHAATVGHTQPHHMVIGASRPPGYPDPDFPIHQLSPAAFLTKLRTYGGVPAEVGDYPDLLDRIVTTARADLRLVETHHWPQPGLVSCPVTAVGGIEDRNVPAQLLPKWRHVTSGAFGAAVVPGGHFPTGDDERRLLEVLVDALR
jgi:medium-chain acyl-[acyl-carrier-protein] hydrolase